MIMSHVGKYLFELFVMRVFWGPWNILVGIVWMIADDVAEDVTAARFCFGVVGTIILMITGVILFSISSVEPENQIIVVTIGLCFLVLYAVLALFLRDVLKGRDKHLFKLP